MNNILLKLIKLIKPVAKVLSKSLTNAINNSFNKGMFSDDAKIACFSPLNKTSNNKLKFEQHIKCTYQIETVLRF